MCIFTLPIQDSRGLIYQPRVRTVLRVISAKKHSHVTFGIYQLLVTPKMCVNTSGARKVSDYSHFHSLIHFLPSYLKLFFFLKKHLVQESLDSLAKKILIVIVCIHMREQGFTCHCNLCVNFYIVSLFVCYIHL